MDKLERVARAIAYSGAVPEHREWEELLPETRRHYLQQAQAAIAALEPVTGQEAARVEKLEYALRTRVQELEAIALDYRVVLHSAKAGRDLYCGMYVAKEYHFTRDQIDAALAKINTALQKLEA